MAPFVFLKQRECEMQLVYTVQNKALADSHTSAHWQDGVTELKFKIGGAEFPDALKHIRKPSLLRTRKEEAQQLENRSAHVGDRWAEDAVDCPEGEVPMPAVAPDALWDDDDAPHMLDVPMRARYAFGIVASVDDNSGRLLADMQMVGERLTDADWTGWLSAALARVAERRARTSGDGRDALHEEDAAWLQALAAAGDRKLATVLFQSSVCTCDTETVAQNDASWRENPERAFVTPVYGPAEIGAAVEAARTIIKRRYVPNAWARRVVLTPQQGTNYCAITPERYQHPAILVHSEYWAMNDSRSYVRVEDGKPALDFAYVRTRYDAFMASLGSLQEKAEGDDADDLVYGTKEYQSQGYTRINALLKLGPFARGTVAPSSRSALGAFWAGLKVSGLYLSNTAMSGNRYAHHVTPPGDPPRDSVLRYPEDNEFHECSLYTLMYHLYENPDCVGAGTAPVTNPYAKTYEQWTANHTLAMAYLRNVYKGVGFRDLSRDTDRIELGMPGVNAEAKRNQAAALIAGAPPMPYIEDDRAPKSPLFIMHKLLKALYFAPRLEREIQVTRGDRGFDFFCDGVTNPDGANANMLKKGAPFQANSLRVGQRFVAQGFTSTSMVAPFAYLMKQSTENESDVETLYDVDPPESAASSAFYDSVKRGGKQIPCCLHLFTLAKGMPILPMFLHGDDRPWLDKDYEHEAEVLLPPNCEMEFLGTTFVPRHHPSEYGCMDLSCLNARPPNEDGTSGSGVDQAEWRMDERVIAYCWFVRYRGVPRGGGLIPASEPIPAAGVAIQTSEADPTADAGEYTDDEDLDWGVGTTSQRTHLREHLHNKDDAHLKRFQERYGTLEKQGVFANVQWPD